MAKQKLPSDAAQVGDLARDAIRTRRRAMDDEPAPTVDVLALGEALVDLISDEHVGSLSKAPRFGRYIGGEPLNVAVNVARLGGRAALAARVGRDGLGAYIHQELVDSGVATAYLTFDDSDPTTLALIARQTGTPDFIIYRGADRHLGGDDLPVAAIRQARCLHASAFALSREPARTSVLAALAQARQAGLLVSLDPNYHPRVWGAPSDHLAVLRAAYPFVDVTKPSLDDCQRLFGADAPPEAYAERFLEWGARLVVLTMGSREALLASPTERVRCPVPVVTPLDVTGAGDAFWAGLLMALLDGLPPRLAVASGLEVASIKVQQVGQLPQALDRQVIYRRVRQAAETS